MPTFLKRAASGGASAHRAAPIVVYRGDILSTSGTAKYARANARIIAERYKLYGVSLFENPRDRDQAFPGERISDAEAYRLAQSQPTIVLHHMVPGDFEPVSGAVNIGVVTWETRGIPFHLDWPARLGGMHGIWAATNFVVDFVRSAGFTQAMDLVPWPFDFSIAKPVGSSARGLTVDFLEALPARSKPEWVKRPFHEVRSSFDDVFVAVQTLAARKGLPVLINEWESFCRQPSARESVLILKLKFADLHGISGDELDYFTSYLRRLGMSGKRLSIGLVRGSIPEDALDSLISQSDALTSSSYGEGFGGTIIEALQRNVPVIAPRHTGIADLLPPDYPFQVSWREMCTPLTSNLEVYGLGSTWCVPNPGAIKNALAAFSASSAEKRRQVCAEARAHAERFCGQRAVRQAINDSLQSFAERHYG